MGANEKHEATYHGGEYTPDEKQLRDAYLNVFTGERNETSNAEFNRAIAKIRAEVWREGCKAGLDAGLTVGEHILGIKSGKIPAPPTNPYEEE